MSHRLFHSILVFGVELCFLEVDDNFVQRAGEFEGHLVVFADWCTGVFAEVKRLVRRDAERDGARDFAIGDYLAV